MAFVRSSTRDPWLDNVRLVAIVLVVVGHGIGLVRTRTGIGMASSNFIYLFHLHLFALVSGWTAGRLRAGRDGLRMHVWQLLVPYVIIEALQAGIAWHHEGAPFSPTFDQPSFGAWYLLSLFTWRLLWPWLVGGGPRLVLSSVVVAIGAGYLDGIGHTLSISRTLYFLPAFLIGAIYGPQLREALRTSWVRVGGCLVLLAGGVVAVMTRSGLERSWLYGREAYAGHGASEWWAGAWRLLALGAGLLLALSLMSLISERQRAWTTLGRYTVYAYVLHLLVRTSMVQWGVVPSGADLLTLASVVAGSALLALLLMTAPLRWMLWPIVEPRRLFQLVGRAIPGGR